jgi:hypothetical protein
LCASRLETIVSKSGLRTGSGGRIDQLPPE